MLHSHLVGNSRGDLGISRRMRAVGCSWNAVLAATVVTGLLFLEFGVAFESSGHNKGRLHLTSTKLAEVARPVEPTSRAEPASRAEAGSQTEPAKTSVTADEVAGLRSESLTARTDECGNPTAVGTSRRIVVDPKEHNRIGTMSYAETLPLLDKEVVLTFDDGPIGPYTEKVLDILASECIHATFFIVGRMAKLHPELVRRAADEGHTIGTHTMNHPLRFKALGQQRSLKEIDDGIDATTAALGDSSRLAPFFRFPGF